MEWVKTLTGAIDYIEEHLTEDLTCRDVAESVYISGFHFQRIFSLLTGMTIGEYIRNRRLSLAGIELTVGKARVIDVALKYGYDTPGSFAKALYGRRYLIKRLLQRDMDTGETALNKFRRSLE